jgi:iron(III) transport system ATP-binding protein
MNAIRIEDVRKCYGPVTALDGVSLQIEAGELFFLLGPSGCGKTTLLRCLAGFLLPDAGRVCLGGDDITRLPPRLRDTAMVFQAYALWPHMSVAQNVAYGLRVRGVARAEADRRVAEALRLVRMEGFGDRRPTQLSGGQQQRVALARALVVRPRVLLLDEPLSNLDARLRDELREEIRRLHRETGLTMVYVTHDQKEALSLADRLAVLDHGRVVQVGPPLQVYNRPVNRFVAGFLGDCNFLEGTVRRAGQDSCEVQTKAGVLTGVPASGAAPVGSSVVCSIRPHALTPASAGAANAIRATVEQTAFLGELLHVRLLAAGTALEMVRLAHEAGELRPGQEVALTVAPDQVVVLRTEVNE